MKLGTKVLKGLKLCARKRFGQILEIFSSPLLDVAVGDLLATAGTGHQASHSGD